MDEDYQLALLLQQELNNDTADVIEESSWKGKENHSVKNTKSSSLVDPQWEFIDPTPDIHVLFIQFNQRFFWGKLTGVEVKWSPRMTSCAGVCVYQGKSGFCSVRLSLPLLKLRPRKDLIETLLHEMIHAFLFVTKNNRDRDGHGPEFHKHMNRINGEAGTHISVYHSFHDEVRLYQQHWWRCNGPCQHRPPFFGMVRRSMNRAPGRSDNWWAQHQATCGGIFIKVKEPDDVKKKKTSSDKNTVKAGDIRSFFPGNASSSKKGTGLVNPSLGGQNKLNTLPNSGVSAPKGGRGVTPLNPLGSVGQIDPFRKPVLNNVRSFGDISNSASSPPVKPITNSAVNNVFGFGGLSGHGEKKPAGNGKPSGKGYVLGGSNNTKGKPPYKMGGMVSNKGSGTFVLSGSTAKTKDSSTSSSTTPPKNAAIPSASVQLFSGTGYVLGSRASSNEPKSKAGAKAVIQGSLVGKGNIFQKDVPTFTKGEVESLIGEPSKRTSPTFLEDSKRQKISTETNPSRDVKNSYSASSLHCPVCNRKVLAELINNHLDDCIAAPREAVNHPEEIIVLSDSDEDECHEVKSHIDCPCCNKKIIESEMNAHVSVCISNSFEDEDDDIGLAQPSSISEAKCPICGENIAAVEMDKHLENCASCSVQDLSGVFDEDFSDEEEDAAVGSPSQRVSESGERVFPCPCCLILIESSKMNEHLDECLI